MPASCTNSDIVCARARAGASNIGRPEPPRTKSRTRGEGDIHIAQRRGPARLREAHADAPNELGVRRVQPILLDVVRRGRLPLDHGLVEMERELDALGARQGREDAREDELRADVDRRVP